MAPKTYTGNGVGAGVGAVGSANGKKKLVSIIKKTKQNKKKHRSSCYCTVTSALRNKITCSSNQLIAINVATRKKGENCCLFLHLRNFKN
jgi:hypothetical protein